MNGLDIIFPLVKLIRALGKKTRKNVKYLCPNAPKFSRDSDKIGWYV